MWWGIWDHTKLCTINTLLFKLRPCGTMSKLHSDPRTVAPCAVSQWSCFMFNQRKRGKTQSSWWTYFTIRTKDWPEVYLGKSGQSGRKIYCGSTINSLCRKDKRTGAVSVTGRIEGRTGAVSVRDGCVLRNTRPPIINTRSYVTGYYWESDDGL